MIRAEIKDQLEYYCPSFSGGFFEPGVATKHTTKPFGVIRVSGEDGLYRQGCDKRIQVAVHAERGPHSALDTLVYEVVDALNGWVLDTGIPKWTGTTGDAADDDRETIFRIVEFEVMIAR